MNTEQIEALLRHFRVRTLPTGLRMFTCPSCEATIEFDARKIALAGGEGDPSTERTARWMREHLHRAENAS